VPSHKLLPIRTQQLSSHETTAHAAHSDARTRQHLGSIVEMRVCLLFRGTDGSERPQRRQSWVGCAGHKVEEVS
jgi:hypothetical protein